MPFFEVKSDLQIKAKDLEFIEYFLLPVFLEVFPDGLDHHRQFVIELLVVLDGHQDQELVKLFPSL